MNTTAKKLIILAGPSGVGKGTIEKILFSDPELKLKFSISATTRNPREGEVNGIHYHFISQEEFIIKIEKDDFIEWNKHFNNYYGTLKTEIEKIIDEGYFPFLEIETVGALNVMNYYKSRNEEESVISIFLEPPTIKELENRIRNRGTEKEEEIAIRMQKALEELGEVNKFVYRVVNHTPEQAAKEIKEIIMGAS